MTITSSALASAATCTLGSRQCYTLPSWAIFMGSEHVSFPDWSPGADGIPLCPGTNQPSQVLATMTRKPRSSLCALGDPGASDTPYTSCSWYRRSAPALVPDPQGSWVLPSSGAFTLRGSSPPGAGGPSPVRTRLSDPSLAHVLHFHPHIPPTLPSLLLALG